MNKFITLSTSSALLLLGAFFITSCSSSGGGGDTPAASTIYTGSTTPAAIDVNNAEAIGKAAGESVQIANSSTGLPVGITIDNGIAANLTEINKIIIANIDALTLPAGVDISADFCSSGTASATDPGSATSGPVDITATFNNCALISSNITVSGTVKMHFDDIANTNAGFSITYTNFKVTDANGTTTINMSMICTSNASCTFNSDYVGTDGVTHRVTDFSFFGNASTGFNGTATFFHGTYGSISITATNITYGSCGTYPDGGSIAFSSTNGSSGTIIFNSDCSVSGTWDNGVTSGSF